MYQRQSAHYLHIAIYILRRIVLALCLVMWDTMPAVGTLLLMLSCLAMLMVLSKNQWWESEIRNQHIVNEVITYIVSMQLLMFCDIFKTFSTYNH